MITTETLLETIRRALGRDATATPPSPPVPMVPADLRPRDPSPADPADLVGLVGRFIAAARRQGAEVLTDPGELAALLERHGPVHRQGAPAPRANLKRQVVPSGRSWSRGRWKPAEGSRGGPTGRDRYGAVSHLKDPPAGRAPTPFDIGCTVARARLGIALSGSVLIDHDAADGDALCVMTPPLLVVELDPARIVATLADALAAAGGAPLPPTRVLVTGPSKTADIEGILVTGVHGPGRVVIALDVPPEAVNV